MSKLAMSCSGTSSTASRFRWMDGSISMNIPQVSASLLTKNRLNASRLSSRGKYVTIHLVQIGNGSSRRVAMVEEPYLRCLTEVESIYELAQHCLGAGSKISELAIALAHGEMLDYGAVYAGSSNWQLLAPIDVPREPSRLLVAGTGLTHLGSAKDRQAM